MPTEDTMLGSDGEINETAGAIERETAGQPPEAPEAEPELEAIDAPPEADRIPMPQPKLSRRDQRIAAIEGRLNDVPTRKDFDELRTLLMQRNQPEPARQQPQRQTQPAGDDDDDVDISAEARLKLQRLTAKGIDLLREGKIEEYEELQSRRTAIIQRDIMSRAAPRAQQQFDPELVALRVEFKDVYGHPDGIALAKMFDGRIRREGKVQGEMQIVRAALEAAKEHLGVLDKPRRPREAPAAVRSAHSGAPASTAASGGGQHVRLPKGMTMADVQKLAKRGGMTPAEYIRDYAKLHPEDVEE